MSRRVFPSYCVPGCCQLCKRLASLHGGVRDPITGLEGWCSICKHHYRQNGQDWILRCLCIKASSRGVYVHALCNDNFRREMVLYLVGSVAPLERLAQHRIWRAILSWNRTPVYLTGGGEPSSDSDNEYEDTVDYYSGHFYNSRCWREYVNPLHKLCFAGRSCALTLQFLCDYQKKHRQV